MDEILEAARKLSCMLNGSEVYKDYRKNRIRLAENPDLSRKLHEFKKKQSAYEMKRLQNIAVTFDEEKQISHLYSGLVQDETAKNYLKSEDEFLTIYSGVMDILNEACKIDIFS